jgi:hypothetical protein
VETRLRAAAVCSIITMVLLAGACLYQNASLPLAQALAITASAGLIGALLGWCFVTRPSISFCQDSSDATAKAGTVRNRGAPGMRG